MPVIDKLAWIQIDRKRLLCVRSRGKDVFFVPGGTREAGESDEEALVREVREELSVRLNRETLQRLGSFEAPAHGQPEGTTVRLTCFTGSFIGALKPAAEIEEMAWLGYADRGRVSLAGQLLFDWLHEQGMM